MATTSGISLGFGGLASGIDTRTLIAQLVALKQRPMAMMGKRISLYQQKKDLLGQLKSKLSDLQSKAETLQELNTFLSYSTTLNQEDIITASADSAATAGNYTITVSALASAESESSQGYADANTTTAGTGTLSITVGSEATDITISAGSDTLADVASAINNSDAEVTATVLNDGSANPYRLVITSNESGLENAISIDASGLSGGDQALVFEQKLDAADSTIIVNGVTITRSSNTIDDAIAGITLNLLNTGSNVQLTVSPNNEEIKGRVEDFVNAYNSILSFLHNQINYDPNNPGSKPLRGDSTTRITKRQLQSIISGAVDNANTIYSNLSQIGITTKSNGTLEIDNSVLEEAIKENVSSVAYLFMDGGVADSIYELVENLTDNYDGLIPNRQEGIDDIIKGMNKRIDQMEYRLSQYEQTLVTKFANLEGALAKLQSLSAYLSGNQTSL